jgi:hypothetical protein
MEGMLNFTLLVLVDQREKLLLPLNSWLWSEPSRKRVGFLYIVRN